MARELLYRKTYRVAADGSEELVEMSEIRKGDRFRMEGGDGDHIDPEQMWIALGDAFRAHSRIGSRLVPDVWTVDSKPLPKVTTQAEQLAARFHEAYERLAPLYGYETRAASSVPWDDVPDANRRLMIAVCAEILADDLRRTPFQRGVAASQAQGDRHRKSYVTEDEAWPIWAALLFATVVAAAFLAVALSG